MRVADAVMPAAVGSRCSMVVHIGSLIGGENAASSITFFVVRMLAPNLVISFIDK